MALRPKFHISVFLFLTCAMIFSAFPSLSHGEEDTSPAVDAAKEIVLSGSWMGAKLKCRKEEGKTVRCGKPEPFNVIFKDDGTGTSADDKFPQSFTYTWLSSTEISIKPTPEGEEMKLFQLEEDDGFLTFQAYIYLPVDDANLPAEANYIHYIFDVSRSE